jgi:hypothetical protein
MSEQVSALKLTPCNNASSVLYQVMLTCVVPLSAALYCIMQLLYRASRGIGGFIYDIGDFQRNGDYEHRNKVYQVFIISLFWFIILAIVIPAFNMISGKFTGLSILFN